jgi:hypothetical protein
MVISRARLETVLIERLGLCEGISGDDYSQKTSAIGILGSSK